MIRTIIKIDEDKCNGCGICIDACEEGAIALIDGKARLIRDDYCDGLGNCLPVCPTDAISFEEREAAAFDEEAVKQHLQQTGAPSHDAHEPAACGCPGSMAKSIKRPEAVSSNIGSSTPVATELNQWPIQLKLIPANAAYFEGADLLIAADCTAFSYGNFHAEYMQGKITLIACPKLDAVDYTEKLTAIVSNNDIRSITVVRMEVPCCTGIDSATRSAVRISGKTIPVETVILPIP